MITDLHPKSQKSLPGLSHLSTGHSPRSTVAFQSALYQMFMFSFQQWSFSWKWWQLRLKCYLYVYYYVYYFWVFILLLLLSVSVYFFKKGGVLFFVKVPTNMFTSVFLSWAAWRCIHFINTLVFWLQMPFLWDLRHVSSLMRVKSVSKENKTKMAWMTKQKMEWKWKIYTVFLCYLD